MEKKLEQLKQEKKLGYTVRQLIEDLEQFEPGEEIFIRNYSHDSDQYYVNKIKGVGPFQLKCGINGICINQI